MQGVQRFFINDGNIHSYPVHPDCEVEYDGQKSYAYLNDIPDGYPMCPNCSKSLGHIFMESVGELSSETQRCWSDYVSETLNDEIKRYEG